MSTLAADVLGIGLWTTGFDDTEAWKAGSPDPEVVKAKAPILSRHCVRRASPIARAVANAYAEAIHTAQVDPSTVHTIFGSALGETGIMLKILDQIWGEEDVSPMQFAVSVHNAASGLVSISTKNREMTTSIAADYDTPAMSLFEGLGVVATSGRPTVICCGDEQSPPGLVKDDETFPTLAVALALGPATDNPAVPKIGTLGTEKATIPGADAPPGLARNPQMGLLDLADVLLRGGSGKVALDRGGGLGWTVEVRPGS